MISTLPQRDSDAMLLCPSDVSFLLKEWLGLDELCNRARFATHSPEMFDDVLALAQRIAVERLAPHAGKSDSNEPRLENGEVQLIPELVSAVRAQTEAGFVGMALDASVGGAQMPHLLGNAAMAWFVAADVGPVTYGSLTAAAANLLLVCGSPEQAQTWVPPMAEGRFFGTMCLTEPQAGSSVGDITTRAVEQPDGTYRISGSKMFIGCGDHTIGDNIVHLVLARLPGAPAGTRGVSLFLVPKFLLDENGGIGERNDIAVTGLNHKMGQRGSVNTVLSFGDGTYTPGGAPGAVGYLVGEPNRGLAGMFHMMNEARVGVGVAAAAIGYTGYRRALRYARERVQGRPRGTSSTEPPVPIIRHPDVRRMLLAQKSYVEGALALVLYCSKLLDDSETLESADERAKARLLLDMLTPIAKSWPSQWCQEANSLAIQVHGGYGYTRDYEVERLYRDNRLNNIHEGTFGIQALDLLGRKVRMDDGAGLRVLLDEMRATAQRAAVAGATAAELAPALLAAVTRIEDITAELTGPGELEESLANASVYLEAVGHVVVAWLWLEVVLAADGKDGAFYDGKRHAARYFYRYELPRTAPQFDLLAARDRTTLDLDESWF